MKIYPHYPKPVKKKISQFMTFFIKGSSWLDGVYERSYTMKMGVVKMPGILVYIPNQPELIHRILVTETKCFPKHTLLHETFRPLLGDSVFTTNGSIWKRRRDFIQPSFEMTRISHVFDLMHTSAKEMLIRLDTMADGRYHNIDKEMTFVTADIIFRTILSSKLRVKEGQKIIDSFVSFQETSAKIAIQKMFLIPKIFRYFTLEKRHRSSGERIRESLATIIRPRYNAMQSNQKDNHQDILSSLLKAVDKDTGKPFKMEEVLDEVAMLFLAGHETTASSMSWTLYLLGLYPKEQEKAYQELLCICGNEAFSVSNIKELHFISNVFKESLRLYPPVSFLPRVSARDTTMRDKVVKKGTAMIISPWLIHRNALYWEDPHMFNPHRFDDPSAIPKDSYIPFGLGPRSCVGERFAMQETVLLLASILRKFRIELEEGFIPDIVGRLTTRSLNGISVKLVKR
ncbi:MAG: cytochrome P450 [Sulfurovum sp.]|nr:cytochrome P450 [Sulfurovum sp.]